MIKRRGAEFSATQTTASTWWSGHQMGPCDAQGEGVPKWRRGRKVVRFALAARRAGRRLEPGVKGDRGSRNADLPGVAFGRPTVAAAMGG
jgi:hypothetical protein